MRDLSTNTLPVHPFNRQPGGGYGPKRASVNAAGQVGARKRTFSLAAISAIPGTYSLSATACRGSSAGFSSRIGRRWGGVAVSCIAPFSFSFAARKFRAFVMAKMPAAMSPMAIHTHSSSASIRLFVAIPGPRLCVRRGSQKSTGAVGNVRQSVVVQMFQRIGA